MTTLIDFNDSTEAEQWHPINDGVMGGCSHSRFQAADGMAVFEGEVSFENNGGFASVRREPQPMDLKAAQGVVLNVRGDGKHYQFRLFEHRDFDGRAYRAGFSTRAGEWLQVELPWESFEPVYHGRIIENASPLDPSTIRQFGLMISERQEGPFRLELAAITTA